MSSPQRRRRRPATTPEERELQMVSLAYDVAERQMAEGTASAQVITQFLKLGSSREDLEQQRLRGENELLRTKVESMKSAKKVEELYEDALNAMRSYSGQDYEEYDID